MARRQEFLDYAATYGQGVWFKQAQETAVAQLADDFARGQSAPSNFCAEQRLLFLPDDERAARYADILRILDSGSDGWWTWIHPSFANVRMHLSGAGERAWAARTYSKWLVATDNHARPGTWDEFCSAFQLIMHKPEDEPPDVFKHVLERSIVLSGGERATINVRRRPDKRICTLSFVRVTGLEHTTYSLNQGSIRTSTTNSKTGLHASGWVTANEAENIFRNLRHSSVSCICREEFGYDGECSLFK